MMSCGGGDWGGFVVLYGFFQEHLPVSVGATL